MTAWDDVHMTTTNRRLAARSTAALSLGFIAWSLAPMAPAHASTPTHVGSTLPRCTKANVSHVACRTAHGLHTPDGVTIAHAPVVATLRHCATEDGSGAHDAPVCRWNSAVDGLANGGLSFTVFRLTNGGQLYVYDNGIVDHYRADGTTAWTNDPDPAWSN